MTEAADDLALCVDTRAGAIEITPMDNEAAHMMLLAQKGLTRELHTAIRATMPSDVRAWEARELRREAGLMSAAMVRTQGTARPRGAGRPRSRRARRAHSPPSDDDGESEPAKGRQPDKLSQLAASWGVDLDIVDGDGVEQLRREPDDDQPWKRR